MKFKKNFYERLAKKFEAFIEDAAKEEGIDEIDFPDFHEEAINSIYEYIEKK